MWLDARKPLRVLVKPRFQVGDLVLSRRFVGRPEFGVVAFLTGDPVYPYIVKTGGAEDRRYHVLTADEIHPVAIGQDH